LKIAAYETQYGNRTIRVFSNQLMDGGALTVSHDVSAGADTGDSFAQYALSIQFHDAFTTNTQVLVEFAGHLALSGNGTGDTWGSSLGSSQISGGPYHFKMSDYGGTSLGSQDNQIKGADISLPPQNALISGHKYTDVSGNDTTASNADDVALSGVTIFVDANGN